jgi:two-component system NtrC family response regulator
MRDVKLLVVEDDDSVREFTHSQLVKAGYKAIAAASVGSALAVLNDTHVDLVISDLHLPDGSGLDLLRNVRSEHPETIFIVMTAFGTVDTAVQAMKAGAYDYLPKPVHPFELKSVVNRALDHHRLVEQVQILRRNLDEKYRFESIVGHSPEIIKVLDTAAKVADSDATVLIRGETGTGKELVAKAIHFNSPRAAKPFVAINCGAIPKELLESELFGHVKGSFTGALTHKKGRVEVAEGGTVFLDEIGDMPPDLQVRILRMLQEREIEKVGATAPSKVNVRIVAATHRDLDELMRQGTFREDLFYRISVVPIELPPLRARAGDIPELITVLLDKCRREYGKTDLSLPTDLVPYFSRYGWPGNIRQLENAIQRIVVLSSGSSICLSDLPEYLRPASTSNGTNLLPFDLPEDGLSLEAVERELIERALRKFDGNQSRAARYLGIPRKTLIYRMSKYGLA